MLVDLGLYLLLLVGWTILCFFLVTARTGEARWQRHIDYLALSVAVTGAAIWQAYVLFFDVSGDGVFGVPHFWTVGLLASAISAGAGGFLRGRVRAAARMGPAVVAPWGMLLVLQMSRPELDEAGGLILFGPIFVSGFGSITCLAALLGASIRKLLGIVFPHLRVGLRPAAVDRSPQKSGPLN